jgi:hypothetical protein
LNYRRLLLAVSFPVVIASQACSDVVAFAPLGASPVSADAAKTTGGGCAVSLTTVVKGFPHHTVAEATSTGACDVADTAWDLTSNPDGVVYRVYVDRDKLLADQPSANGRGAFLRLVDFIHTNPVCLEATLADASARVGLLGSSCPRS